MARPIVVQITGDSKGFGQATRDASEHASKFASLIQGIGAGIGFAAFNLAAEAIHKIVDQVKESDDIFRQDQVSASLLGQAMRDNIPHWNGNTAAIENVVAAQARLGYSAETVRDALGQLIGVTHDQAKAQTDLALAEDFARAHHLDLASAVDIVSKVSAGNARALKTYGINIAPVTAAVDALHAAHKKFTPAQLAAAQATDKAATAAAALKAMYDQTKGAADAYANTAQGKLEAAQAINRASWAKIGAIVDQVSSKVLPIAAQAFSWIADVVSAKVAPAVSKLITWFQDHLWPALQQVWAAAQQLAGVLQDFLAPMFQYIRDHIENLKPVLIAIGVIFAVVAAAIVLVVIAVIVIVTALVVAITWMAGKIADYIGFMRTKFQSDFAAIGGFFNGLGTGAHNLWVNISTAFNSVVSYITGMPGKISKAAGGMWDGIKNAFRSALNWIIDRWNGLSFKIPSFDFLGQHTPGVTLSVPHIPRFHQGGTVPGSPGSDVLIMAQAGERVTKAGASSGGDIHIHIEHWYGSEGPDLDRFANKIAQRLRFAPGI